MIQRGLIPAQPGMGVAMHVPTDKDWKATAPVIQDGKVVFASPDANALYCLNLRDGSLAWKVNKSEEDLYLGGVYKGKVLIVGKKTCRALSLDDGSKEVWRVDSGMPSGQGIVSDNIYYLPLKSGNKTKEPEVCAIDIENGFVLAHTRSRKKAVPGNLLFHDGYVLSQGVDEVDAYPQLSVILAQSDELIKKNPNDPVGLETRARLRLDKGDLQGAIDDLHQALANHLPKERVPEARSVLFESMSELLQRDFTKGEKYVDEYRDLCKVETTPEMLPDVRRQKEEEQQRRLGNCLCLIAKGREQQGKLLDAFDAYQEYSVQGSKQELIGALDDPGVKAAPEVSARGRITAMLAKATPEQRKPLEERLSQKYAEIKKKGDVEELRQFVDTFGSLADAGKEARLLLAERLMEDNKGDALLKAEMQLLALRNQTENRQVAGQAVEALARLWGARN